MRPKPRIPMNPGELPQQRITLAVALPPRPAGFEGKRDPFETDQPEVRMPRSAKYLGQVEWAWSPNNSRIDAYYLSTNRERTRWILWLRYYDDNWSKWAEPQVYAYAPKGKVPSSVAAVYLLLDAWTEDIRETPSLDKFHWINAAEFLSVGEINAIGRAVWSEQGDDEP